MMRCPNCGSTAQVRMVRIKDDKINFRCGCGCKFYSKVKETKIIEKNQKKS